VGVASFFHVSLLAPQPGYRRRITLCGDSFTAGAANRMIRIVVDLAAGDDRNLGIEKTYQPAQDPRLGLPAQTEQDEMMPREHGLVICGITVSS